MTDHSIRREEGEGMKAYVLSTGILFGVITLAHVWRMAVERPLASDPAYIAITTVAAVLGVWSWRVFRRVSRP